jgi:hypothetical protein
MNRGINIMIERGKLSTQPDFQARYMNTPKTAAPERVASIIERQARGM